jgi:hypothetical protein
MAVNPFFQPHEFRRTWGQTGRGMQFGVQVTGDVDKKWKQFHREFHKQGRRIFSEQGSSLCWELAEVSFPSSTRNPQLTANNALSVYEKENKALANVAFKSWDSKKDMFWMMSDYMNVKQYIVQRGLFKTAGPAAENLAKIGRYDLLDKLLRKRGYYTAYDVPKPQFVMDKAQLGTFINWKRQWKQGRERGPYYVKDKASIDKISREKSLMNFAGIAINGWIKAAKALGDKPVSGVKRVMTPFNTTTGGGGGRITAKKGAVSMTFYNDYYNLNGIFYQRHPQQIWKNRMSELDKEVRNMFTHLENYWKKINP